MAPYSYISALVVALLSGCTPPREPVIVDEPSDSAEPTVTGSTGTGTEPVEPQPFTPSELLVRSLAFAVEGEAIGGFSWKEGAAPQSPQISVSLLDERWFVVEEARWRCDWTGSLTDLGETEAVVDGMWFTRLVSLAELETDCGESGSWTEGPAEILAVEMVLAIGPLGGRSAAMNGLMSNTDTTWGEVSPYTVGVWLGPPGGSPVELGYAFSYALDEHNTLIREPSVELQSTVGGVSDGLLRGMSYSSERLEAVFP